MEKKLKPSTPPFKMVIFDLFWPCPATFGKQFSAENSWNQLINWRKKIIPEHHRTVAHFPISILNKQLVKQHLSFQTDIIPVLLINLSFPPYNIPVLLINLCFIFVLNWHLLKLFLSPGSCFRLHYTKQSEVNEII